MDAACLIGLCAAAAQSVVEGATEAAPTPGAEAEDDGWVLFSEAVTALGIAVLVLAQLLAPAALRLYRRLLTRLMGESARHAVGARAIEPRERRWPAGVLLAAAERRRLRVLWVLIGVVALYAAAAAWSYRFEYASDRNELISLAVSWCLFASFSAPVVLLGVSASRFASHFWTYFAPAAFAAVAAQIVVARGADFANAESPPDLLPVLGAIAALTGIGVVLRAALPARWRRAARHWLAARRWRAGIVGALAYLLLIGLIEVGGDRVVEELDLRAAHARTFTRDLTLGCALAAVAIALCYVTLVDRSKRIVVPLLAAALFVIVVVTMAVGLAMHEWWLARDGGEHLVVAVTVGLGVALLVAWFLLSWIGLAYERKLFSDAQFQVFCWMISVAGVVIFVETLAYEDVLIHDARNLQLAAATGLALLAYWVLTRWFVKPLRTDRRLLVLRVFAQDSRGERLLDALEYRWRFIGPIVLIGGPDMAARTIDPAKAAGLLRLRIKDAFVPSRQVLHKRVAAMDDEPDPDGRYRVNEFYCFDDLWKEAVERLLDVSDAVVLDLRGFNAERRGTAYEIGLLARCGALPRTVFLVDRSTDRAAVRAAMREGGSDGQLPPEQVMEATAALRGRDLVDALVRRMPPVGVAARDAMAAHEPAAG